MKKYLPMSSAEVMTGTFRVNNILNLNTVLIYLTRYWFATYKICRKTNNKILSDQLIIIHYRKDFKVNEYTFRSNFAILIFSLSRWGLTLVNSPKFFLLKSRSFLEELCRSQKQAESQESCFLL